MDQFLDDPKVPLQYYPIAREYGLDLYYSPAVQMIRFCPWCGTKLPKRLGQEYLKILKEVYNVEPELDIQNDPNVPEEFKSDLWWKKRGL
jgi:hypothetical protein